MMSKNLLLVLILIIPNHLLWPENGLAFGFCDAPSNEVEIEIFDKLAANYVRMDVKWSLLEKIDGSWDFSRYDELIINAAKNNRRIILILDYDHPKVRHRGDRNPYIRTEYIPEFLTYVGKVYERWGDLIAGFEIWNEPNMRLFWEGSDSEFFELCRETVSYLKRTAPGIPVAVGSLMLNPWVGGRCYVRKLLDAGILEAADALSIHPYGYWIPSQAKWVAEVRKDMDDWGYYSKELWITEVGYPTKSLYPYRVTVEALPLKIAECLIRLSAAGAEIITWYQLYTSMEDERNSRGFEVASFALLYREPDGNYIPKNGLETWGRVAGALTGLKFIEGLTILENPTNKTVHAFGYGSSEGKRVLFLWSKIGIQALDLSDVRSDVMIQNIVTGEFVSQNTTIQLDREPIMFSYHSDSLDDKITISGSDAIRKIRIGGF